MSWVSLNAQWAIASGAIRFEHKQMSIKNCSYDFELAVDPVFIDEPLVNFILIFLIILNCSSMIISYFHKFLLKFHSLVKHLRCIESLTCGTQPLGA